MSAVKDDDLSCAEEDPADVEKTRHKDRKSISAVKECVSAMVKGRPIVSETNKTVQESGTFPIGRVLRVFRDE